MNYLDRIGASPEHVKHNVAVPRVKWGVLPFRLTNALKSIQCEEYVQNYFAVLNYGHDSSVQKPSSFEAFNAQESGVFMMYTKGRVLFELNKVTKNGVSYYSMSVLIFAMPNEVSVDFVKA